MQKEVPKITKDEIETTKNELDTVRNAFKFCNYSNEQLDRVVSDYVKKQTEFKTLSKKEKIVYFKNHHDINEVVLAPYEEAKRKSRILKIKQSIKIFFIYLIIAIYYVFATFTLVHFFGGDKLRPIIFFLAFIMLYFIIPFFIEFLLKRCQIKK